MTIRNLCLILFPELRTVLDCQMPEMDGYQATRAMCVLEAEDGSWEMEDGASSPVSLPIVAMTACAMDGEKEQCLVPGMDDSFIKPIVPQDLERVVVRRIRTKHSITKSEDKRHKDERLFKQKINRVFSDRSRSSPDTQLSRSSLDLSKVREWQQIGGTEFFCDFVQKFFNGATTCMQEMEQALAEMNLTSLAHTAHGFRGLCVTIGAIPLGELSWELEEQAQTESVDLIHELLVQIQTEYHHVSDALKYEVRMIRNAS